MSIQRKTIRAMSGETIKVIQQWAAETEKRATTVSSSAWEFSGDGGLTSESLATPMASVLLSPTSRGTLTNTATLANGEVVKSWWLVDVS